MSTIGQSLSMNPVGLRWRGPGRAICMGSWSSPPRPSTCQAATVWASGQSRAHPSQLTTVVSFWPVWSRTFGQMVGPMVRVTNSNCPVRA